MYPSNFFIGIEKFLDKIHMLWVHKIPFPCQQDTCVKTEYVAAVGGGVWDVLFLVNLSSA